MDALTLQRLDAISKEVKSLRQAFSEHTRESQYQVVAKQNKYVLIDTLTGSTVGARKTLLQIVVYIKGLGINIKQVIFDI
jgi:hypothetical protein